MHPLQKALRHKLEKAVKPARDTAEDAARAALEQLGVERPAAYSHLTEADRMLRRRLRAHGRQLGDKRSGRGEQALDRLVEEVAYQHWHRMLFARFLAENDLLMYPDPVDPVAVTLEECEDLAADEGAANGWELAARYAARMLPQIFRPDSPVFELSLPPEHQQTLERLVTDLPTDVFTASDSLGWVYQFWQAKRKDEVNKAEVKIGARELPAVTQLFTEPYMVSFLLDNSLGAWWAARRLTSEALKQATGEAGLRQKAALPGVPLAYLRFVKREGGAWTPAAGTFEAWPQQLCELKVLDPCCGSGHFLVAAFLMLVPMRMELEGLAAREAADAVLRENLHGLELDPRCVELAAFALAMAAWTYPGAGGYRPLPELNLACSGLAVGVAKKDWKTIAECLPDKSYLPIALDWMYDVFRDAPTLGSLIDPGRANVARLVKWKEIEPAIRQVIAGDQPDTLVEAGVVAHGIARATHLLSQKYHWVITNVPYLARGKQGQCLRDFCGKHYKEAKNDLATVFLDRCLEFCEPGGTASIVLPQNWLFLTTYRKFREELLKRDIWHLIARLGPGAFETISGEVVKAILLTISRGNGRSGSGILPFESKSQDGAFTICGLDVSELRTAAEKAKQLVAVEIKRIEQARQLENPDARIVLEEDENIVLFKNYANGLQGISPADAPHYGRFYWELFPFGSCWHFWQSTIDETKHYGGRELILWYGKDLKAAISSGQAYLRGTYAWNKFGIVVRQMQELPCTLYSGNMFDTNCAIIVPNEEAFLPAIWCFCSSPEYNQAVRCIDQKLNVTNATLVKVPFDLDHWTKVAQEKYPNGLPKPYSDDPTQWIFHGHPCGSVIWDEEKKLTAHGPLRTDDTVLQVAVARLLGYRWPAELDADMELADEQRQWVRRSEELLPFADEDGIVCIPPVRGEASADDRLLDLLAAAYGDQWSSDVLNQLLASAGHTGKTLETWLWDKFFAQHCKLFHHRPFIWHIWDGLRDGFAALANYHKFDAKLLETLIYTYLGDWIRRPYRENPGNLAMGQVFRPALQTVSPPPLHLAHLGRPARWFRRPGQLPQVRRQAAGNPDLHLPGRLDPPAEAGHRKRRRRRSRKTGCRTGLEEKARVDPGGRGTL